MTQEERLKDYEALKVRMTKHAEDYRKQNDKLTPEARALKVSKEVWGWRKDKAPIGLFPDVPTSNTKHWTEYRKELKKKVP